MNKSSWLQMMIALVILAAFISAFFTANNSLNSITGFTTIVGGGENLSTLIVYDDLDNGSVGFTLQNYVFYANYTNTSDSKNIVGADCYINFTDISSTMSYNSTSGLYEYTRSFTSHGTKHYNVSCYAAGFEQLNATDETIAVFMVANSTSCGYVSSDLTLTENIESNGNCFTIGASNVILDCNGNSITGDGTETGINITKSNNVTVKNCTISNYIYTIYSLNTSNVSILYNDVSTGNKSILLENSPSSVISENRITNNINGGDSIMGVQIRYSSDSIVNNNYFYDYGYSDLVIDNSDYVLVENNTFNGSVQRMVFLVYSEHANITRNTLMGNTANGIFLQDMSYYATVADNVFSGNANFPFVMGSTSYAQIINNVVLNGGEAAIALTSSTNVLIFNNSITGGNLGISAGSNVINVTILNNTLYGFNSVGINLNEVYNSTISGNVIQYSGDGILFNADSYGNNITEDNYFNVTQRTIFSTSEGPNYISGVRMIYKNQTSLVDWGIVNGSIGNLNNDVVLGTNIVSLNATNEPILNISANVSLAFAKSCPAKLYYLNEFTNNISIISTSGQVCNETTLPSCTNIVCEPGLVNFTVEHFDSYGVLGTSYLPNITEIILNSTFGTNLSSEDLTVYWESNDMDGDPIINITDWRVNGNSILAVNMPFEAGSNSTWTKDYSTYNNSGLVVNATWCSDCGHNGGGAYLFNGSRFGYISVNRTIQNDFTITFWMNTTATAENCLSIADGQGLVNAEVNGVTNDFGVNFCRDKVMFGIGNPERMINSTTSVNDGVWYFVAARRVKSTGNFSLFINGVSESSKIGNKLNLTASAKILIGEVTNHYENRSFNGTLDEIKIYDRALSDEQILLLYSDELDYISEKEINPGENWTACITPNDGEGEGETVCSNDIFMKNSLNIIDIYPNQANEHQSITDEINISIEGEIFSAGFNATITAADSEIFTFEWFVNGISKFIDTVINAFSSLFNFATTGEYNVTVFVNGTGTNDIFTWYMNTSCIVPTTDGEVSGAAILCPGEYYLPNGTVIPESNTVLDCGGSRFIGDKTENASAVRVGLQSNISNITIKNCYFEDYSVGLWIGTSYLPGRFYGIDVPNITIFNITAFNNTFVNDNLSIKIVKANNIFIESNSITGSQTGIGVISDIIDANISGNVFTDIRYAFDGGNVGYLSGSGGTRENIILSNNAVINGGGFYFGATENLSIINNSFYNFTTALEILGSPAILDGNYFENGSIGLYGGFYPYGGGVLSHVTFKNSILKNVAAGIDILRGVGSSFIDLNISGSENAFVLRALNLSGWGIFEIENIQIINPVLSNNNQDINMSLMSYSEPLDNYQENNTVFFNNSDGAFVRILFNGSVAKLNDNVFINNSLVAVNSSAEPNLNNTATVSFIVPSCSGYSIFTNPDFFTTKESASAGATNDTQYDDVVCSDNRLNFTTTHFSTIFTNYPPNITIIYPNATNETETIGTDDTNVSFKIEGLLDILFNVTADDADSSGLTFTWFVNGVEQVANIISTAFNSIFNYFFGSLGLFNVTIVVNDSIQNDSFTFYVNVTCSGDDNDGDGFYTLYAPGCGPIDCNDNDPTILPPGSGDFIMGQSITFCPGSYVINQSIQINGSNLIISCNNTLIDGNNSNTLGLNVHTEANNSQNITIRDCTFVGFDAAVYFTNVSNSVIVNNTFINNDDGIRLYFGSNDNLIANNTLLNTSVYGIYFTLASSNNTVSDNLIVGSYMVVNDDASNQFIMNNNIFDTQYGIYLRSSYPPAENASIINNTFSNAANMFVQCSGLSGVLIENNTFINSSDKMISLSSCLNSRVISNYFDAKRTTRNVFGGEHIIYLSNSNNSFIFGNNMTNIRSNGIYLTETANATITNNIIRDAAGGILLFVSSDENIVSENIISSTSYSGIKIEGIDTDSSENNLIVSNIIFNATKGIEVKALNNNITNNTIYGNTHGIWFGYNSIFESGNNTVFNNVWFNNTQDIYTDDGVLNNLILTEGNNTISFIRQNLTVNKTNNIYINNSIAAINTTGEPQMNLPASVSFQVSACDKDLAYASGFYKNIGSIPSPSACTICTLNSCSGNMMSFSTTGFSTIYATYIPATHQGGGGHGSLEQIIPEQPVIQPIIPAPLQPITEIPSAYLATTIDQINLNDAVCAEVGGIGILPNLVVKTVSGSQYLRNVKIGYQVLVSPFKVDCDQNNFKLSFSLPDSYTNITVLRCAGGNCKTIDINSITKLNCAGSIFEDVKRKSVFLEPNYFPVNLTRVESKEGEKEITSSRTKVIFTGDATGRIAIDKVFGPVPEAKNPRIRIVGTPTEIIFQSGKQTSVNVTLPYVLPDKVDELSIAVYALKEGTWNYLGGDVDLKQKTVTTEIKNPVDYSEKSKLTLAAMGLICLNCYKSELTKVYAGTSKDAVVFVHGFENTPERFEEIINDMKLTNQPWQAWTFGYPSNKPTEQSAREMADLLQARSNEYQVIYIVTHSLGGIVAQEALNYAYEQNKGKISRPYPFIDKVVKVVAIASPNKGSLISNLGDLFNKFINNDLAIGLFNLNSGVIKQLEEGKQVPRVPNIEYLVVAGTQPYDFTKYFKTTEANDGLVSVSSAQTIGGQQVNNPCDNFWSINVTHTDLLNNFGSRKIVERIISDQVSNLFDRKAILGYNQYYEMTVNLCSPSDEYIIIGIPIDKEAQESPGLCNCGNGVCGIDETPENCPSDCAVIEKPEQKWWQLLLGFAPFRNGLIVLLLIIVAIILISRRRHPAYAESEDLLTHLVIHTRIHARMGEKDKMAYYYSRFVEAYNSAPAYVKEGMKDVAQSLRKEVEGKLQ